MALLIHLTIYAALTFYAAGTATYIAGSQNSRAVRAAFILSAMGLLCNFLSLVFLTLGSKRLPLASGYEFILSFAFITVLIYLIYEIKSGPSSAGSVVMAISTLLALAGAILVPAQPVNQTLMPALKSPWLAVHVFTAVIAYSGFALAAGLAVIQLKKGDTKDENPVYRAVGVSFAFLSLSIVLGAIWAEQAWGSYWSWDPKETWALITWIVYAAYLHLYRQRGWSGKPAYLIVIAGFAFVVFTFFGVNYLMSGMHSYALSIPIVNLA